MKLNIIDRIIYFFSPSWAEKRMRSRANIINSFKQVSSGRHVISRGIEMNDHKYDQHFEEITRMRDRGYRQ